MEHPPEPGQLVVKVTEKVVLPMGWLTDIPLVRLAPKGMAPKAMTPQGMILKKMNLNGMTNSK